MAANLHNDWIILQATIERTLIKLLDKQDLAEDTLRIAPISMEIADGKSRDLFTKGSATLDIEMPCGDRIALLILSSMRCNPNDCEDIKDIYTLLCDAIDGLNDWDNPDVGNMGEWVAHNSKFHSDNAEIRMQGFMVDLADNGGMVTVLATVPQGI